MSPEHSSHRPAAAWLAVTSLLLLMLIGLARPALAHTELVGSSPAASEVVTDPPSVLTLTFSEAPKEGEDFDVEVVDGNGDDLVAAPPTLDGTVLSAPLNLAVVPGRHMIRYIVVAEDGDPIVGELSFDFQPPPDVATPLAVEPTSRPTAATAIPTEVPSPPPPTPDPTVSAAPVPTVDVTATPTALATEILSDGGVSPAVGVILGLLALAAVGAVAVFRLRDPDEHR